MTGHARKFDENATMSFTVNNKQLLKNYIKIWEKVEKLMKIDFESKPLLIFFQLFFFFWHIVVSVFSVFSLFVFVFFR